MLTPSVLPTSIKGFVELKITWQPTGDAELPLAATLLGKKLQIRINDFPAEPLFSLLIDGVCLDDLDEWPRSWERPPISSLEPTRKR